MASDPYSDAWPPPWWLPRVLLPERQAKRHAEAVRIQQQWTADAKRREQEKE